MAKFTKLNIDDSVASSGGRVWKKLSVESAEVQDELVGTWKVSSSGVSYSSLKIGNLVYADNDIYEPIGTFKASGGTQNDLICAYNLNGMQHSAICRLSGSKNYLTFCRPYKETSSVSQFDASYIRNATITFNENIANVYVDDTFRAWLKANATKTA